MTDPSRHAYYALLRYLGIPYGRLSPTRVCARSAGSPSEGRRPPVGVNVAEPLDPRVRRDSYPQPGRKLDRCPKGRTIKFVASLNEATGTKRRTASGRYPVLAMAIKVPHPNQLSEPLEGDDARRLVEYIELPTPPEGHDEYLREADSVFARFNTPRSANEPFE